MTMNYTNTHTQPRSQANQQ